MVRSRVAQVWAITVGLLAASAVAILTLVCTGAPLTYVGAGTIGLGCLAVQSWRSGARFEADAHEGRPLSGQDPPEIRRELFDVCEATGRPIPEVVAVRMDVPGVMVGYSDGQSLIAVDSQLVSVVGPDGLRALFAHELGHLGADIHTDAIRQFLPQTLGFTVFWLVVLAGQDPIVTALGSGVYLVLAPIRGRYTFAVRSVLSLGVEPVVLALSRYADRQEEYVADAYAASVVSPEILMDALYHIAAVATGDNDEDVAGPVPWNADRTLLFSLLATHPSIESRADALNCAIPAWVSPYRPHLKESR